MLVHHLEEDGAGGVGAQGAELPCAGAAETDLHVGHGGILLVGGVASADGAGDLKLAGTFHLEGGETVLG